MAMKPLSRIVLSAAAIAAAARLVQQFRARGPWFAVGTGDGLVHRCGFNLFGHPIVLNSFETTGAGRPNWEFAQLSLSPDTRHIAVQEYETVSDATDVRVTVHDAATGDVRFSRTDNSYPTGTWTVDDAPVPPAVVAQQAYRDQLWQEDGKIYPRPIVSWRFFDHPFQSNINFAGWRTDGLLVTGECAIEVLVDGSPDSPARDSVNWWAVVTGLPGTASISASSFGLPPAWAAPLPQPAPAFPLTINGGALYRGATKLNHPKFAPGVTHVAGPYPG